MIGSEGSSLLCSLDMLAGQCEQRRSGNVDEVGRQVYIRSRVFAKALTVSTLVKDNEGADLRTNGTKRNIANTAIQRNAIQRVNKRLPRWEM